MKKFFLEKWRYLIGVIIIVTNIIDSYLTFIVVKGGFAVEVNPYMEQLLFETPVMFFGVKLLIPIMAVGGYFWYIARGGRSKIVDGAVIFVALVYVSLMGYFIFQIIATVSFLTDVAMCGNHGHPDWCRNEVWWERLRWVFTAHDHVPETMVRQFGDVVKK